MKKTPEKITLTIRQPNLERKAEFVPLWCPAEPVVSHLGNCVALNAEAFECHVIDAVQRSLPLIQDAGVQKTAEQFIRQEANHADAHDDYAQHLLVAGYKRLLCQDPERHSVCAHWLNQAKSLPDKLRLVIMIEHLIAVLAREFLLFLSSTNATVDATTVRFLRYHAIEEIEHKGVAFDCYTSIYSSSPMATPAAQQQWQSFLDHMRKDMLRSVKYCLMVDRLMGKQHGLTATAVESTLATHFSLFAGEGTVYRLAEPGFHPWDIDDRALLARWDTQPVC